MDLLYRIIIVVLLLPYIIASYKKVCYYDSGAMARHGRARCGLGYTAALLCSHLVYGFAVIRRGRIKLPYRGSGRSTLSSSAPNAVGSVVRGRPLNDDVASDLAPVTRVVRV
ncbi:hypothetical protein LSAT2_022113 [Lamellibrachia satsuma]|nr:hypothetical protein LSAT2_022113 [Lamellibrachia satsuma]